MTRYIFITFVAGCLCLSGCHDDIITTPDASAWRVSSDMEQSGDMVTLEDLADISMTDDASMPKEDMSEMDTGFSCPEVSNKLCRVQDALKWDGECRDVLGAFFDGTRCQQAMGCACENPQDCPVFASMEACTTTCGQAGMCH